MIDRAEMTLGENLRSIRKELGLRQHEIVGEEVTRNLISMIENNKTPLYYRTAKLISDNINRISNERNLDVYVDPEDIMNPKRIEAKRRADEYIEKLNSYLRNNHFQVEEYYIREIEAFLKKWNIPEKKVIIYGVLAKISSKCNDTQREYTYLTKALENYYIKPIKRDIYILGMDLLENCIRTGIFNEAINLSNLEFMQVESLPDEYKRKLCYNLALAYKNLKRWDEALEWLQRLKKFSGVSFGEELRKGLILEAICYNLKGDVDKAKTIYITAIHLIDEEYDEFGLAYASLIDLYINEKNKEKMKEMRDKLVDYLTNLTHQNNYLPSIYFTLARACQFLEDIDLAEEFFISSIQKSLDNDDNKYACKAAIELMNLYNGTKNEDKILLNKHVFVECLKDVKMSDRLKLILRLIQFSLENNKIEEAKDIIDQIKGLI